MVPLMVYTLLVLQHHEHCVSKEKELTHLKDLFHPLIDDNSRLKKINNEIH